MPALLVRELSEESKRQLAIQAAQHGRSQQAEAKAILEAALCDDKPSWVQMVQQKAHEVGGFDIPLPQRHAPRITGVAL